MDNKKLTNKLIDIHLLWK